MRRNLEIASIENAQQYRKDVRKTMNGVMASGASVFKCKEESSLIMQGVSLMGHSAIY